MPQDIFDPTQAGSALQEAFLGTVTQRERALRLLEGAQSTVSDVNQNYLNQLQILGGEQAQTFQETDQTLSRLQKIERYPRIVGRVLGLFDTDWDSDFQIRELQKQEAKLSAVGTQLRTAEVQRQAKAQIAASEAETATALVQLTEQGFLNVQRLIDFGFQVSAEERARAQFTRQQTVQQVQDASLEDLQLWARDPSKAPASLKNKTGLIQAALLDKVGQQLGIESTELANEINRQNLETTRKRNVLHETDNDVLRQIASGQRQQDLAFGLTAPEAQEELNRRQRLRLDLRAMQLGVAANDMQFVQAQKAALFDRMAPREIQDIIAQIDAQGGNEATVNGVTFTRQEAALAFFNSSQREFEQQSALHQRIIANTGVEAIQQQTTAGVTGLAAAMNDGFPYDQDNPLSGLPFDLQTQLIRLGSQADTANDIGSAAGLIEANTKMRDLIVAEQEKFVAAQPKETQQAVREFLQTAPSGARITTPDAAAKWLTTNATNPNALITDPTWGGLYAEFTTKLNELRGQEKRLDFRVAQGGITQTSTEKPTDGALVEAAIKETQLREKARAVMFQDLAKRTLVELASQNENLWSGIVSADGRRFRTEFYDRDPTTQVELFNPGHILDYLAMKTVDLQSKGILQPDQDLANMLYDEMLTRSQIYNAEIGSRGITPAALNNVLFKNRGDAVLGDAIDGAREQIPVALRTAQQLRQAIATATATQEAIQAEVQSTTGLRRQGAEARAAQLRAQAAQGILPGTGTVPSNFQQFLLSEFSQRRPGNAALAATGVGNGP